jgi:hypothetical protein
MQQSVAFERIEFKKISRYLVTPSKSRKKKPEKA